MSGIDDLAQGIAFINAGQARRGLALVRSHLAYHPDDPEAHAQLAQAYVNLDENESARDAAVRSLALRPDREHPLRLLAYALAQLGDRSGAVKAAEAAQRVAPDSWATHFARANVDVAAGRFTHAGHAAAQTMLRLAPDLADAHVIAGAHALSSSANAEERERARGHLQQALAIDSQYTAALHMLSELELRSRGRKAKAILPMLDPVTGDPTQLFNRAIFLRAVNRNLRPLAWTYFAALVVLGFATAPGSQNAYVPVAIAIAVFAVLLTSAFLVVLRVNLGQRARPFLRSLPRVSKVILARLIFGACCVVFLVWSPWLAFGFAGDAALGLLAGLLVTGAAAWIDQIFGR